MTIVTFLSLGGVFLVLVVGFGGLRHSLLATVSLVLGTIWTVGYTTVTVGYRNILSIAFGSIPMGLGDQLRHLLCPRYLQLCATSRSTAEARGQDGRPAWGPASPWGRSPRPAPSLPRRSPISRGIAQLGVIAGGGILLCWLAAMTVLPALIVLFDTHHFGRKVPAALDILRRAAAPLPEAPTDAAAAAAATAAMAVGMAKLWYDDNLLNLQPIGLESVELERKLLTETNQSAWFALSVANDATDALRAQGGLQPAAVGGTGRGAGVGVPVGSREGLPCRRGPNPPSHRVHSWPPGKIAGAGADDPRSFGWQLGQVLSAMAPAAAAGCRRRSRPRKMAQLSQLFQGLPPQELRGACPIFSSASPPICSAG